METPTPPERIFLVWLASDNAITFVPRSHIKGGEYRTKILYIEDGNSSVRRHPGLKAVDMAGAENKLVLGFFERGCGSAVEVERILRDCVEDYDVAEEEFWYLRFYDDLAEKEAYWMTGHVLVAMKLLFGHVQMPERFRVRVPDEDDEDEDQYEYGHEYEGEYEHEDGRTYGHTQEYSHGDGYGHGYSHGESAHVNYETREPQSHTHAHEHTHGESEHVNYETREPSGQYQQQYETREPGEQYQQQYEDYRQDQRQQYEAYKQRQQEKHQHKHTRRRSHTAAPSGPRPEPARHRRREPVPESKPRRKSTTTTARPEKARWERKKNDKSSEDARKAEIFAEMKKTEPYLYDYCKRQGAVPKLGSRKHWWSR
ncbi:hypothetical protein BJX64DRAFT_285484 [Aspergillus heterothallicus]